jgi:hypothetical protein
MSLRLTTDVLEGARACFEAAGVDGFEATALIAGHVDRRTWRGSRLFVPDQRASRSPCFVEVTKAGKLQLAAALAPTERWVARIHSHPAEAFHSSVDDRNPFLTAEGSWSIVVPYFGLGLRGGIERCAIFRRVSGRWSEVDSVQVEVSGGR